MTSIFRNKEEDAKIKGSGIHACWRAVDIRTHIYTELEINKLVELCNKYLHYDSGDYRDVAVYGDARHQDHIHLQIGWRV